MTVTVRPATKTDIREAAAVLADAFFDDPVMEWMWPDDRHRRRGLSRMFATEARFHSIPAGGAEIVEGPGGVAGGAALWTPPDAWKPSAWQSLCMTPRLAVALGRRASVGMSVSAALDAT